MSIQIGAAWGGTFFSPEAMLCATLGGCLGGLIGTLQKKQAKDVFKMILAGALMGEIGGTMWGASVYYGPGGAGFPSAGYYPNG